MPPVKPRCTFKECRSAAQRIIGDCGFCDGHYCAKHRLLEDHKCTGLEDVSISPSNPPAPAGEEIGVGAGTGAGAGASTSTSSGAETPASSSLSSLSLWSLAKGDPSDTTTQWWLVGLAECLTEGGFDCKKESHERNAAQLEAERTQVIKGI
ncbi:hypothetical protein F4775DRAFT_593495 [Biscogniauxia sp. FL1348]|nr:hypothetical protein F4775DRAFT_593495 [Biscogniauxia sp. FL1348]